MGRDAEEEVMVIEEVEGERAEAKGRGEGEEERDIGKSY